jgi:hypothetical protein
MAPQLSLDRTRFVHFPSDTVRPVIRALLKVRLFVVRNCRAPVSGAYAT